MQASAYGHDGLSPGEVPECWLCDVFGSSTWTSVPIRDACRVAQFLHRKWTEFVQFGLGRVRRVGGLGTSDVRVAGFKEFAKCGDMSLMIGDEVGFKGCGLERDHSQTVRFAQ